MAIFIGPKSLADPAIGDDLIREIYKGDTLIWERVRELVMVFVPETTGHGRTDNGEHVSFTVDVPDWATAVEAVLIGAGAHGVDGVKTISSGNRQGGAAGAWSIGTLPVTGGSTATITVARGTSTSPPATMLSVDGHALSAAGAGGPRPTGGPGGTPDPASQVAFDVTHTAGAGGAHLGPGTSPGGGGGGGWNSGLFGTPKPGAPGGNGYVWLRFTRTSEAPTIPPFVVGTGATYSTRDALRTWAADRGLDYKTATAGPAELDIRAPGNMSDAFNGWSALARIPEGNWADATRIDSAFSGCESLTSADLTFGATDASRLFSNCAGLQTATITAPNLDTALYLFRGCAALATVSLDTPALESAQYAFNGCESLTSVNFHLPALETMSDFFSGASKLQSVTITGAANVKSVGSGAFNGCTSLTSLILDGCGPNMVNAGAPNGRLDLSDTKLTASAANALMRALGNTAADKTPRLTLPSTAAGANTALATNKGWEVVMG